MSSNSPSGGMKLIVRSESNSFKRTHWWNWQSSNSTASPIPFSLWSNTSLSFKPNLHSGVPDRYALMRIWPSTSARRTVPDGLCQRTPHEKEIKQTFGTHDQIDCLNHVYKRFVFLVFDIRSPPTDCPGCLCGNFGRFLLHKLSRVIHIISERVHIQPLQATTLYSR